MPSSILSQDRSLEYEIENFVICDRFYMPHSRFMATIHSWVVPTFYEAMKWPRWREAMRVDIEAQEKNKTCCVKFLSHRKWMNENKWIFMIKYNSNGLVERHKANIVTCGNQ